jgi:VWFA-related protein
VTRSSRWRSSLAVGLGAAAALAGAVAAQSVPVSDKSAPDPHPVRVDVIVTDKSGKPILNLRPEEFSILDNGTGHAVVSATLGGALAAQTAPGPARPPSPPAAIETREDEERAAKEPGTRVIGLYLDEFHVSAGPNSERVRQAAARFIDEQLRPADLLVIIKPLDQLTDLRFTRNRDVSRQAIASFGGRKDDYTPRTTFEEQYMGRSASAVRSARAQIVLSGLRAMSTRIGELGGGLSAVVVLTEGFSADGARSRERRLPDLQGLVRIASRSRVMLYAFDPSEAANPFDTLEPLRSAARQSGGEALGPGEELHAGLQRVSRDLDAYYVITYRSTSPDDGRFHELQIASTRRDARVRGRSGYWAPLPELRLARSIMPALLPMRAVRRSPLIESWFGTMIEPDGRRRAIFTWSPALISSVSKPTGRPELVTVKVSTPTGKVLFEGDVSAAHAAIGTGRRTNSAVFDAGTGRLQFDLTILRADGSTLDTSAQDYDVPELRGPAPVIFQPQLFAAASAREFREIAADVNAAPLPARQFRRTDRLLMRVPTYDPGGGEVKVSAKLMNQVGAVLANLDRAGEAAAGGPAQFDLSLARFAPGEYALEVAANSSAGTSRQLIRFKITS